MRRHRAIVMAWDLSSARRVAAHELRLALREGPARLALLGFLAVLGLALWSARARSVAEARVRAEFAHEVRGEWLAQGAVNPHSAAHFGTFVQKPVTPLAALDPGVDPCMGTTLRLEAHAQNDLAFRPMADAGGARHFGLLSPVLLVQVFGSLLVLLWSVSLFAGERETGTLATLLVSARDGRTLVLGKGLALAALCGLLVTPLFLLGAFALERSSDLLALASLTLAHLLWLAGCAGTGAWLGLRAGSLHGALARAVLGWLVCAFVVPRVAAEAADTLAPLPSRAAFELGIQRDSENGFDGHDPRNERRKAFEAEVLERYGVTRTEDLPVNFDGLAMQADEEYGARISAVHFGRLWATLRAQERAQLGFGLVSPLLFLRPISMAVAGTDTEHFLAFARQAEAYRFELVRFLNDSMARNSRTGDWDWKAPEDTWALVADFRAEPPPVSAALARTRVAWLALAAWCAGSLTLATRAARRYRP